MRSIPPKIYPRIRFVEISHIADLIRIAEETNLSRWTAQNYLDELQIPDSILLRLESERNETIGFMVGRVVQGGASETQKDAEIYNIAVMKNEQNRGFGQRLFDAFVVSCRKTEIANIWLEVRASNKKAIAFYERNGFEHFQSRNNFYQDPREPALLMRLILKQQ